MRRLTLLSLLLAAACGRPAPTAAPQVTPALIATSAPATAATSDGQADASPTPPALEPTPTPAAPPAPALGYVTSGQANGLPAAIERARLEFDWSVETQQGAAALEALAQAGAPVIVVDDPALAAATRALAESFPGTYFVGVGHPAAEPPLPNLLTLGAEPAREDQLGFVAGALGGLLTEGRILTAIGYTATPEGLKYRNGFLHGVRYTCSRCRVDFIDSVDQTSDAAAVAERARLNASLSSDVVFAAAGPAGLQGLQAAAQQGAWVLGVDPAAEAAAFAPGQPGAEQWVTSVFFDHGAAVFHALQAYHAGAPLSGALPWSAASGALVVAPYNVGEDVLSPLDLQDIQAVIARLADGSLETGIDPASGQAR